MSLYPTWSFLYDYAVVKPMAEFIIILMAVEREPFKPAHQNSL